MEKVIEILQKIQHNLLEQVSLDFKRRYWNKIDWSLNMIGLL